MEFLGSNYSYSTIKERDSSLTLGMTGYWGGTVDGRAGGARSTIHLTTKRVGVIPNASRLSVRSEESP